MKGYIEKIRQKIRLFPPKKRGAERRGICQAEGAFRVKIWRVCTDGFCHTSGDACGGGGKRDGEQQRRRPGTADLLRGYAGEKDCAQL